MAAQSEGKLLVLDGDGRVQQTFEDLPSNLLDIALVPSGDVLAVSYSEVVVTGDIEIAGDEVYLLDDDTGSVVALNNQGQVTHELDLR